MNRNHIFEILYALAARGGRQEVLFGDSIQYARPAFARSCPGEAFPELWFELPLLGDPWFDLHVLTDSTTIDAETPFSDENTGGYPNLFAWFATAPDVRQLALSYDSGSGNITQPAIQLLVRNACAHVPFLERAGGPDYAAAYRAFEQRLPDTWFPCYTGVHPSRDDAFVRVECIPRAETQSAYAADAGLLEAHLRQAGLSDLGDMLVSRCQTLAQAPLQLEFQFDVLLDGTLGDTFGASVRFAPPIRENDHLPFSLEGPVGELMQQVEDWGLADGRWRLLADTTFSKRISRQDEAVTVANYPAFLKLRWRAGAPLDAKTYLIALFQQE